MADRAPGGRPSRPCVGTRRWLKGETPQEKKVVPAPRGERPRLLPELAGAAGRALWQRGRRARRALEVLPAVGGRVLRSEPEARPEDTPEEAAPEVPRAPSLRGVPPGSWDSWEGEEDREPGEPLGGRTSRTASLVSGLLTELYSCTEEEEGAGGGRGPAARGDSLDSSTEASGSDVVLGGRGGAGGSNVLQELQERPSQRHQRQYLQQKGEGLGGESWRGGGAAGAGPCRVCPGCSAHQCAPGLNEPAHRHQVCRVSFHLSLVSTGSRMHEWTYFSSPPPPTLPTVEWSSSGWRGSGGSPPHPTPPHVFVGSQRGSKVEFLISPEQL
ncbi:uncharacterized protein LOC118498457 [Phyllostomus discolor]|uniref:Uncharacterized protein LOC118498457 n=1 Tax=Phyllostomus discolor TaxID=89673 RepID=A0A7E6D0E9_9CHIR|nr:uncharacterized protein LOC118498457 [Phyllostomus discolor]